MSKKKSLKYIEDIVTKGQVSQEESRDLSSSNKEYLTELLLVIKIMMRKKIRKKIVSAAVPKKR